MSVFVTLMIEHCTSFKSMSHSDLGMVPRSPDPWFASGCCLENQTSSSFSVPWKKCAAMKTQRSPKKYNKRINFKKIPICIFKRSTLTHWIISFSYDYKAKVQTPNGKFTKLNATNIEAILVPQIPSVNVSSPPNSPFQRCP